MPGKKTVVILSSLIILILIGYIFRLDRMDRFGTAKISWVDCIQINNVKYYRDLENTTIKASSVGKKIGKVKFNVSKKVSNPNYRFRNGDATFLKVGTGIYSLDSEHETIAVKIGDKYILYESAKARQESGPVTRKPVIYLYPTSEQIVSVRLDYKGKLTCTYPEYKGGWKVKARPDGTLINSEDNREYSYLYWEGISNNKWDMSKGFVIKGSETQKFLQEKLEYLGLTPREYNEFIVYWLPIMVENKYNLITFAGEDYESTAQLMITPHPDSILRVMMIFRPLNEPVKVEEQVLKPFVRKGFTVVEWGGTEIK